MTRSEVQDWLDRYVDAWRKGNPELIEGLFTVDAVYRFRPYGGGETVAEGRAEIVQTWLEDSPDPRRWEAKYEAFAADDDRGVAAGTSRYFATEDGPDEIYHNCFLIRFAADGRCAEFTEYYMLQPDPEAAVGV